MRSLIVINILFFLSSMVCFAEPIPEDVKHFMKLLSRDVQPTLSDYNKFYGQGAEDEIRLRLEICKNKGWTPPLNNKICLDYIARMDKDPEHTTSLYLAWLRTKLPSSPLVKIHKIENKRNGRMIDHDLIYASLNNVEVVFDRTAGSTSLDQFGLIGIYLINGIYVSELLERDFNNGFIKEFLSHVDKQSTTTTTTTDTKK